MIDALIGVIFHDQKLLETSLRNKKSLIAPLEKRRYADTINTINKDIYGKRGPMPYRFG